MATIKRFEDLEVWKKARIIAQRVWGLTKQGSFARDFELRDQINRASGSVMDNIAEGFERDGRNEFKQHLSISKGSCGEVRSQMYRALDRGHITTAEFEDVAPMLIEESAMLRSLIAYLRTSEFSGHKFSEPDPPVYGNDLADEETL